MDGKGINGVKKMKKIICPVCLAENIPGVNVCAECFSDLTYLNKPGKPVSLTGIERELLRAKIREVISPPATLIPSDMKIKDVLKVMQEKGYHYVLIVDPENHEKVVGLFTERSVVRRLFSKGVPVDLNQPVSMVMLNEPITLKPYEPVTHLINAILVGGYRVVVKEQPPRLITIFDVMRFICEFYPDFAGLDKLQKELREIALADGIITEDEQAILDCISQSTAQFLETLEEARNNKLITKEEKVKLVEMVSKIPKDVGIEAMTDRNISEDEQKLLQKIQDYFVENRERFVRQSDEEE